MILSSRKLVYTTAVAVVFWGGWVQAQCYAPNGTAIDLTERGWKQCPPAEPGAHTQCCAEDEECGIMGLCVQSYVAGDDISNALLYREYCTDPTWATTACSNLCISGGFEQAGTILTWCEDDTICCGLNNQECCEKGEGETIDENGRVVRKDMTSTKKTSTTAAPSTTKATTKSAQPTTTESQSNTAPNSTPAGSSMTTSTNASGPVTVTVNESSGSSTGTSVAAMPDSTEVLSTESSGGLTPGAIAGVGAGAGAFGMLAIIGVFFFWWKKRRAEASAKRYQPGVLGLDTKQGYQPTGSIPGEVYQPTPGMDYGGTQGSLPLNTLPPAHSAELPHHQERRDYMQELPVAETHIGRAELR